MKWPFWNREQRKRELDEEIESHLQMAAQAREERGEPSAEAYEAARREMGNEALVREATVDTWGFRWIEDAIQDLRYGGRLLLKNRGFALVAIATLALGIGANTAIFSVVNGTLLRPLPYKDSSRLVLLQESLPPLLARPVPVSAPDIGDFRKNTQVFEDLAAAQSIVESVADPPGGAPEQMVAARVSAQLFSVLGISPLIGRTFSEEEDTTGRHVMVLSHALWARRFGSDPDVLGRTLMLDRVAYTIIGVMPPQFVFPPHGTPYMDLPASFWVPISFTKQELEGRADNFNYTVVSRLKPGVTLEEADANVKVVGRNIQKESYPATSLKIELTASVAPMHEMVVGKSRALLLLLLGAVGFLLLIACANVANLLLSRAATRGKEVAIRLAMGAGRLRLVRQLLVESVVLSLTGGILGTLLALWGTSLLVAKAPTTLPLAGEVPADWRVLTFAAAISFATGLLFGAAPAAAATRSDVNSTLKEGMRGTTEGRHAWLRAAFVVSQVAMALVLVIGAGLLIRSFVRVRGSDAGFRAINVLTMQVTLPDTLYNSEQTDQFFQNLLAKISHLPGVESEGAASDLPLEGGWTKLFSIEEQVKASSGKAMESSHTILIGDYLKAAGIPLKRGRLFTADEEKGKSNVLLVSEGLVRRDFPNEDPIGKRVKWGSAESDSPWMTIIGIVGDVKQASPDLPTRPHTYEPFLQACHGYPCSSLNVAVRARMNPEVLTAAVQGAVQSLDSQEPIAHVRTLEQVMEESLEPRKFNLFLLTTFAAAALALAALGIYGVLGSVVTQQTHEIGIRMALGAQRRDVLRLVVGYGVKLAALGLAIGLAGSLALTRLMASLLYEVTPTDPLTFTGVAALLGVTALVACYIPARRASRVDPIVGMRYE